MRLTAKFVVSFVLGMLIVLAINGRFRLARETGLFEANMRRHAHLFGHALGNAVAWAWHSAGQESALALVEQANEKSSDLDVHWVWLDETAVPPYRPALPLAELAPVLNGHELSRRIPSPGGPGDLFTYVPVQLPDGRMGALQIAESLSAQHEFIQSIVRTILLSMASVALVVAALAWILGTIFVGRPTRALLQKAHRIGSGDLDGPLALRQRDELGEVAAEMNAMCDRLKAARDTVAAESAARASAMDQLRHADRLMTVGRLASGIAHELGTPLNVVSGRAQMIASGELMGAEVNDSARIIVEQSRRMTQIIRQLLDFARPKRSQKTAVSLSQVVEQVVRLLQPIARKRGVSLDAMPSASAGESQLDDGQIQQALMNLVVNAIHATAAGGRITIGWQAREIEPPADHGGARAVYYELFVKDTGSGMNEETKSRIFEPFFTTKEVGDGTGLGLSVTYGIVKEHKGWIDVRSEPGVGSTFSVYLPFAVQA